MQIAPFLNLNLISYLQFIFNFKIRKKQTEKMGILCDIDEDHDYEADEMIADEPAFEEVNNDHDEVSYS